jgi:hypothetical protein
MRPRLKDWTVMDLRSVTGNQAGLGALVADWAEETGMVLKDGEGLLVTGRSQKGRPRIVCRTSGMLWVLMVPWDPVEKLSVELAVNLYLRKTYRMAAVVRDTLDEEIERLESVA